MLKHQLIHPKINEVLGRAGHGSKVLIADGNYPASSTLGPRAELVSLNLSPGLVSGPQVLEALLSAIPIEAVGLMQYQTEGPHALSEEPEVWGRYRELMAGAGLDLEFDLIERFKFYEVAGDEDHVLSIQTGEEQPFANVLLTIGVRKRVH
ncbi:MAG: RbsD/FucU family protein [Verrucomicrobiota bacterium]